MPKTKTPTINRRFETMATESGIPTGSTITPLNPVAPPFQTSSATPTIFTAQQMEEIIRKIVKQTLEENTVPEFVDETINDTANLGDLDKTPDIVKAVRDFDGNPTEYTSWRKSVDRIFNLYGELRGTAKYYGILTVIRSKIIGQANTALESYNTPLNWLAIKQCLNTHYSDKRDISTLEYQLTTLIQGKNSIEHFYQQVYSNFSLILNNISGMGLNKHTEDTLIETYRNKALDTFVRGLNGDLPRLLAIREPKTLPEALYVCTKLANQDFRTNYAYNNQHTMPPPRPPKNFIQQYNTQHQKIFSPQATNFNLNRGQIQGPPRPPQPMYQQPQAMQYTPRQYKTTQPQHQSLRYQAMQQHPLPQYRAMSQQTKQPMIFQTTRQTNITDTQPPPEPMKVDRSIRSQQIDYANRPRQQQQITTKRPPTTQFTNQHQKQQRNYHIYTNESNNIGTSNTEQINEDETTWEQYLEEHDQHEGETFNNHTDVSDIHFLE